MKIKGKKAAVAILASLITILILNLTINKHEGKYVLFESYNTLTESSTEDLVSKFESNHIRFKIDEKGNIFIHEKDSKKAISCCT